MRYAPQRHLRCTHRACGKRFKGVLGVAKCPACNREGRLDKWADAKPWRQSVCYCDAYYFPHREGSGACCGPRPVVLMPGVSGLPF